MKKKGLQPPRAIPRSNSHETEIENPKSEECQVMYIWAKYGEMGDWKVTHGRLS
jgi:hypothetical protein